MRTKILRKFTQGLTAFFTLLTVFLGIIPTEEVHANTLELDEKTSYSYVGYSSMVGRTVDNSPIYIMKIDGKRVFCVESGVLANSGTGYVSEKYVAAKKEILSKIAYYGYTLTNKTELDYATTQVMIWEELGDNLSSTDIPNYQTRKAAILKKVEKHDTLPSWNSQTVNVTAGTTTTLKDTNQVLSDMTLTSNNTNMSIKQDGNTLTLSPNATSKTGTLTYQKVASTHIGTSIIYRKTNQQSLVEFHLENQKQASIKLNVTHLGNLEVKKIDATTKKVLPNTTLHFEYGSVKKDIVTDKNGVTTLSDITEGTTVTVTEMKSPNGYINQGLSQKITIEPNKTVRLTFTNQEQKGIATIKKMGQIPEKVTTSETKFGKLYQFEYDYQALANVHYQIKATKDIHSIDGSLKYKKGTTVETITTDKNGEAKTPELYLGNYEAVESNAPKGYTLTEKSLSFTLTYAGQNKTIATTSLAAKNDFQTLHIQIMKDEEVLTAWSKNQPVIHTQKADGQVFGLFTREAQTLSDGTMIPTNSLVGTETVDSGIASFKLKLPQGKYYAKELETKDTLILDTKEYAIDFTAQTNQAIYPITIYQDQVLYGDKVTDQEQTPLRNTLHKNQFSIKKANEQASFDKNKVTYAFSQAGTGATFTLSDRKGKIMQEVVIDKNGMATFKQVPVGTYYLKEKAVASDDYLLDKETIRIESTKTGIQALNAQKKVIASQPAETKKETATLLSFENKLIKGTVVLTKKDISTGKVLPNTKVRILNQTKKVLVEGKTDKNGIFTFKNLPKGQYYFQEVEAPTGYQVDTTPIKFEIKENGKVVKCNMTNQKIPESFKETILPETGDANKRIFTVIGACLSIGAIAMLCSLRKKKNKLKK